MEAKAWTLRRRAICSHRQVGGDQGELSGSEDLYVDGNVEGSIELRNNSLTVGPNGKVKANVSAKVIVVLGQLEGTVTASDRWN